MPAQIGRRRADEQGAQLMQLPAGGGHHQDRRTFHTGKRLGRVPQKTPDDRAGEMFVRRRDRSGAPQVPDALRQRRHHALQQALGAERGRGTIQRVLQRAGVEPFYRGDAFLKQGGRPGRLRQRARGLPVVAGSLGGELVQRLGLQLRHQPDAVAGSCEVAQQAQPLDLLFGIKTAVRARPGGRYRAITLLPNPNDVRAQPGAARDAFDGMMGIVHKDRHNMYMKDHHCKQRIASR